MKCLILLAGKETFVGKLYIYTFGLLTLVYHMALHKSFANDISLFI